MYYMSAVSKIEAVISGVVRFSSPSNSSLLIRFAWATRIPGEGDPGDFLDTYVHTSDGSQIVQCMAYP